MWIFSEEKVSLFWWSEIHLTQKAKENYGDLIGKYIVEKISNRNVVWVHPGKRKLKNTFTKIYFTVGSILSQVKGNCIVWGSGIISREHKINKATFLAVRGPQTRKVLIQQGHNVPEIYGDPALLMPVFFKPVVIKKFELGIIPHYVDYEVVLLHYRDIENVVVIDLMTNDVEQVTQLIASCNSVISSSLHGLIVAHAYRVPAIWAEFSNKIYGDGVKYQDYFESVNLVTPKPLNLTAFFALDEILVNFYKEFTLPKKEKIEAIQSQLMACCPFI
ncbi:polysaccharide pyruvyl transferase family protein [Flavobacterium praedii]|uniref:polysaccharide pyruvyl transferase family protein n=1 Tax=Flavobacterium praedii TaxID=3002900 RepID=UPI0024820736|nr:polysaccharide pyruvyl transferase family protein [Flavobacterium praedii]